MNTTTDQCIDTCNKLLRGELSAVETYRQAAAKFESGPERDALARIQSEHEESAGILKQHVCSMGAAPSTQSGAWGAFARVIEGTAKVFGGKAALVALQEGEAHGISVYEDALADEEVMDDIKAVIREVLLPRLHEHADTLTALRKS